jgi:hypothetical protein
MNEAKNKRSTFMATLTFAVGLVLMTVLVNVYPPSKHVVLVGKCIIAICVVISFFRNQQEITNSVATISDKPSFAVVAILSSLVPFALSFVMENQLYQLL